MNRKTIANFLIYSCLILGCYVGAFFIRLKGNFDIRTTFLMWNTIPAILLCRLIALAAFGRLRGRWPHSAPDDPKDLIGAFNAACMGSLLFILTIYLIYRDTGFSRAVFLIEWALFLCPTVFARRVFWEVAERWLRRGVSGLAALFTQGDDEGADDDAPRFHRFFKMARLRETLGIANNVFAPDVWITLAAAASLVFAAHFSAPHLYRWWASANCSQRLDELEARISSIAESAAPELRGAIPSVRAQLDYQRYRLEDDLQSGATWGLRHVVAGLHSVAAKVEELESGADPYDIRYGFLLRGYESEIDDTIQPYSLYAPKSFSSGRKLPLIVKLHGHGWFRPFQGYPAPEIDGAIVLSPHGRGSNDYMYIGEMDVLRSIQEVKAHYNVDADRVYLMGSSMGGTGAWNLATHFPDRFAAIAPQSGNADYRAWVEAWDKEDIEASPEPAHEGGPSLTFAELKRFLKDRDNPAAYAENLLNVPVYCTHGSEDKTVPVGHARSMVRRLRMLNYNVTYLEYLGYGHGGLPRPEYNLRLYWLAGQQRIERPKRVRYKTARLRHSEAYWVKINQFEEPLRFAEIDARVSTDRRSSVAVNIHTRNISSFALDLTKMPLTDADDWGESTQKRNMSVTINDDDIYEDDGAGAPSRGSRSFLKALPPADEELPTSARLTFQKARGDGKEASRWIVREGSSLSAPSTDTLAPSKRARLEGPIEDAMLTPFLVVYGATAQSELEQWVVKEEAMAFVREWERRYGKPCRVKADTEVTPQDIERFNLILYGGPKANEIVARINDDLPIRMAGSEIVVGDETFSEDKADAADIGLKMCYPNPLNPERYVVVFAGVTWKGMYQINSRFGNWFDWIVYDNRNWFDYGVFDSKTKSPETFLCVGFFDQHWQLSSRFQWRGVRQLREDSQPRKTPEMRVPPPDAVEVFLSDLIPTRVDQQKGPIGFDITSEGNAMRLGDREYHHGVGVRVPSKVTFEIGGRFERFKAIVGIDLEGKEDVSRAREEAEEVQFQVFGDDKLLYETRRMKWNSEPEEIDVPIRGVNELKLRARAKGAKLWLFGSADWAEARVVK